MGWEAAAAMARAAAALRVAAALTAAAAMAAAAAAARKVAQPAKPEENAAAKNAACNIPRTLVAETAEAAEVAVAPLAATAAMDAVVATAVVMGQRTSTSGSCNSLCKHPCSKGESSPIHIPSILAAAEGRRAAGRATTAAPTGSAGRNRCSPCRAGKRCIQIRGRRRCRSH